MRLIVDASAAVNVVMRTDRAAQLIERLERAQLVLAPSLFHSEVANTLWKYIRAGELDKETALTRYDEALALVDAFEPDQDLATEALSFAVRHGHPVYDLLYVVLAMRHGGKVLSEDRKLLALIGRLDESMLP